MPLPSVTQIIRSVENPHGMFRTLEGVRAARDYMGRAAMSAGRNAAVFRVETSGREMSLKCYIRPPRSGRAVCDYLQTAQSPCLARPRYLEGELYVYDHNGEGRYHDVEVCEWVHGTTLAGTIARAAREGDRDRLASLAASFDDMARHMLASEWAHGDLKPENIIVTEDHSLKLIDFDAFFVPSLAGCRTTEIGSTSYQHPLRDASMYDRHIDDYPIAVISVSLHALARRPELYTQYNRGENIILGPREIIENRSPLWLELQQMWEKEGEARLYTVGGMLKSPRPALERLAEVMETGTETAGQPVLAERGGRWGFTCAQGGFAVAPVWDEALNFSESLAAVRLGRAWYFIDTAGRVSVACPQAAQVKSFSCGLAAVQIGGRWGYIDRRGETAIDARFDRASSFRNGRARVEADGREFEIDTEGNIYVQC